MMTSQQYTPLIYTAIPMLAVWLATILTILSRPKGIIINCIQALAAGVLLAGIAVELLPKLNFHTNSMSLTAAFIIGLTLMLLLKKLNPNCCSTEASGSHLIPFVTAFCIEFFINGIMIVLAGWVSLTASLLVAISLGICCFVCGMSVAVRFNAVQFSKTRILFSMLAISFLFIIGGLFIWAFIVYLSAGFINDIVGFGIAVLLYIATADLLFSAFKNPHGIIRITFFIGFVLILLLHGMWLS